MHGDNLDITPLDEQTARTHMAALFRLTAREGLHEGISNRAIRRWAALFNEPLWGAFAFAICNRACMFEKPRSAAY